METIRCKKCKAEIIPGASFCHVCGAKQGTGRKARTRGNGQGTVYQLPNKTWQAEYTAGYEVDASGKKHRLRRTKAGFKTKKDALAYLPELKEAPIKAKGATFRELYDKWEPTHRAGKSTMNCYHAAVSYFAPLWDVPFADVDIDDLQICVDDCPKGKRTRENMKALCGLLYKYAIPRHLASLNLAEYLIVGGGEAGEKNALPVEAVEKLRAGIGAIPYADYIVAQCYLGFRPSELLALDVKDYDRKNRSFTGGAKTDAGKDRIVTVSPKIQPIIDRLTACKISGPVFCGPKGTALTIGLYRTYFYAALEAAGIDNPVTERDGVKRKTYTPHSCRHTFATLLKNVTAPDEDKLRLIGHTSTEMLRHYQDVNVEDLRKITNAL